jgi:hypothetical protein
MLAIDESSSQVEDAGIYLLFRLKCPERCRGCVGRMDDVMLPVVYRLHFRALDINKRQNLDH